MVGGGGVPHAVADHVGDREPAAWMVAVSDAPRHPGGRPSKYEDRFCAEVEAGLSDGLSLDACAGLIGVARSTIYEWLEAHPEFSDAVKAGQAKSVLFWERKLLRVAEKGGGPGTATAVIFGLKNRAPQAWRDKVDHEHSTPPGAPLQHAVTHGVTDDLAAVVRSVREEF